MCQAVRVQGLLNSAISLLALEAAQEKGKVHGWLGHQIQQAHQLLTDAIFNPYAQIQDHWIELCQIPDHFLQLGLPHPEYKNCIAPGVFRYENRRLQEQKEDFLAYLTKASTTPAKALEDWITLSRPFLFNILPLNLKKSLQLCLAIQLTEGKPEILKKFI